MKFKPKYFLVILPVLVGMFSALNANLSQAGCRSGDIYQMITESKKCETIGCLTHYLNKLEACKAETEAKKQKAAEEAADLQKEVSSLESSISQKNASIASLNSEIANLQYQIEKTSKEIEKIEKRMEKNKKTIEVALKSFYEYDKENIVTIILAQSSFSEFFDEVFYVESVQKKISKIIEQLKKDKKELKEKKKELAASKETLEAKRNKLATERNILAQEKAEQASLLDSAKSSEAKYAELNKVLAKETSAVAADLSRLRLPPPPGSPSACKNAIPVTPFGQRNYSGYIGNSNSTIYQYGCALTSVAMVFNYYKGGITPPQIASRPELFDYDLIKWAATGNAFGFSVTSSFSLNAALNSGQPVVVQTRSTATSGSHYVLFVGYDNGAKDYLVLDPWYGKCVYLNNSALYNAGGNGYLGKMFLYSPY